MKPNQDIRFLPYRTADRGYGKLYRSPACLVPLPLGSDARTTVPDSGFIITSGGMILDQNRLPYTYSVARDTRRIFREM